MGTDTLVVAVGDDTTAQINAIAQTVLEITEETEVRVIIAHVLRGRRDTAVSDLDEEPQTPAEKRFIEQAPAQPGTEGDMPEWVRRWSQRQIRGGQDHSQDRDQDEQAQSDALERVLARKAALQQLADTFDTAGIKYELRGAIGNPTEHIVQMAEEADADFVVVSSQTQSPVREALFSSLAQNLLRSAPCPVIVVREDILE